VVILGILTSLDIRSGPLKTALGFLVSVLGLIYATEGSSIGSSLSLTAYPSLVLVSLPPAFGVVLSALLFSSRTRFRIPKENILASLVASIGLGLASTSGSSFDLTPALDGVLLRSLVFVPLALAGNSAQMGLLHFLEKFLKTKRSVVMMPSLFFSLNSLTVLAYFASRDPNLEYAFLSSLIYVPLLAVVGSVTSGLSIKAQPKQQTTPKQISAPPVVIIAADRMIKQGQNEMIRVVTSVSGRPADVANLTATLTLPTGKREDLRLSHKSQGKYAMSYFPRQPGTYSLQVAVTKNQLSTNETFSFTVQSPPTPPPIPKHVQPLPQPRNVFTPPPRPIAPPPIQAPKQPSTTSPISSSRLDDWDPRAWLNQDVHGYRVKEHIATGATGYVLRASFGTAGSEMALKIPILKTTTGATALNETMAEATTLLELSGQSKYVVQIKGILVDRMNIQEIMKGDTGLYLHSPPTIVMEYMRGGNAKRLVEDSSYEALYYSEKWPGVVMLMGQMISTALETIHGAGFVHLDVKPQNILFNATPPATGQDMIEQMTSGKISPKLADLGSAVRTGGKVVQFTSEYAPVEQVLGSGADPSMDIYALGATMYSMLTKTPVHSKKLIDAMNNMISNPESNRAGDELRSIWKSFNPDFTRIDSKFSSIVPVLAEMMAKEPRRRPVARETSNSLRNVASKYSG
jgi:serine/threonine protein kinase